MVLYFLAIVYLDLVVILMDFSYLFVMFYGWGVDVWDLLDLVFMLDLFNY